MAPLPPELPDGPPPPDPGPLPEAAWVADEGRCEWHTDTPPQAKCAGCERTACGRCLVDAHAPGHEPGEGELVAVCPVCAPLYGVNSSVPFEQPERGALNGFFTTFGWAVAKPNQLWRSFPHGGVGRATLFALLAAAPFPFIASSCLGLFYVVIAMDSTSGRIDDETGLALVISIAAVWGLALLYPLGLAMLSLPMQLACRIGGSTTPWSASYRMLCYLTAIRITAIPAAMVVTVVLSIVPMGGTMGQLGPEIWHAIVAWHGVRRVHGVRGWPAVLAVILPPLCLCFLSIAPIVMLILLFN